MYSRTEEACGLAGEPQGDAVLHRVEGRRARAELRREARHRPLQSAGHDQLEVREVRRDIQRESMHRYEPREAHADRRDLAVRGPALADPDACGRGVANAHDPVHRERIDHALLEPADIRMHLEPEALEIEDRIRDKLPGAVVGHIATAVGLDALDSMPREERVAREDMVRGADAPRHGHDGRRMLEQKHRHRHGALATEDRRLVRLALERERIGVADPPEVEHADSAGFGKLAHGREAYGGRAFPYNRTVPKIHPTAVLDGDISLADDVEIGPHCVLRGRISLGPGCVLIQGVHLQGPLAMGAGNACYPGVSIGFAPQDKGFHHAKDGAGTEIGDGNSFRECVTIHRATRDDRPTRVGSRNFWMVNAHAGHDVQVGSDCVIANNTMFGGHAEIADRVVTGGAAAVHQFARVGRGAMVSGLAGVSKDVCPFFTVSNTNYVGSYNRIGMRRGGFAQGDIEMVRELYGIIVRSRLPYSARVRAVEALAGHPVADEFIAFIRSSKRGVMTRHGRATSARGPGPAGDE